MTAQLSATVAPLVGTKALIKIIIKGTMTSIRDNKAKGINIKLALLFLPVLKDLLLRKLESKFIWVPLSFV
jgi:hypothetical protein